MDRGHQPVLLEEVIASLMVSMDGAYVDGTFGRGGHSTRILDALSPLGTLLALDQDPAACVAARHLSEQDARFRFQAGNFRSLNTHAAPASLQGVLLDLGVSSPQLDDPERGFSFSADGPLDMRMDPTAGQSAQAWLATVDQDELAQVLKDLGEERFAKRIAGAIVSSRAEAPITRTSQLAEIISAANPKWEAHKHPATRSFQAIRLFVNSELEALKSALVAAVEGTCSGGTAGRDQLPFTGGPHRQTFHPWGIQRCPAAPRCAGAIRSAGSEPQADWQSGQAIRSRGRQ